MNNLRPDDTYARMLCKKNEELREQLRLAAEEIMRLRLQNTSKANSVIEHEFCDAPCYND